MSFLVRRICAMGWFNCSNSLSHSAMSLLCPTAATAYHPHISTSNGSNQCLLSFYLNLRQRLWSLWKVQPSQSYSNCARGDQHDPMSLSSQLDACFDDEGKVREEGFVGLLVADGRCACDAWLTAAIDAPSGSSNFLISSRVLT